MLVLRTGETFRGEKLYAPRIASMIPMSKLLAHFLLMHTSTCTLAPEVGVESGTTPVRQVSVVSVIAVGTHLDPP
jgi:hypothetical protein